MGVIPTALSLFVLGPSGTNSHEAAKKFTQGLYYRYEINFCRTNREVLESCLKGGMGVVPIENGSAGYVGEVIKFWLSQKYSSLLKVIGEMTLPISHHLIVRSSVKSVEEIKEIISHPHALEQCTQFLQKLNVRTIPAASTAEAARQVSQSRTHRRAAIASIFAARTFGLKILRQKIENSPDNATCFHLVGHSISLPTGKDKTAVLFRLPGKENKYGSLLDALSVLKEEKVNMSRIHSIPLGTLGSYAFYCEFDCHSEDKSGKRIIEKLKKESENELLLLGSFPRFCERKEGEK